MWKFREWEKNKDVIFMDKAPELSDLPLLLMLSGQTDTYRKLCLNK